jgi:hypothetical protein
MRVRVRRRRRVRSDRRRNARHMAGGFLCGWMAMIMYGVLFLYGQ